MVVFLYQIISCMKYIPCKERKDVYVLSVIVSCYFMGEIKAPPLMDVEKSSVWQGEPMLSILMLSPKDKILMADQYVLYGGSSLRTCLSDCVMRSLYSQVPCGFISPHIDYL